MTKQGLEAIERAAAHENCACVPEGWKLVPVEPTAEIMAAAAMAAWPLATEADLEMGRHAAGIMLMHMDIARGASLEMIAASVATMAPAYRAMLAAAPAAPTAVAVSSSSDAYDKVDRLLRGSLDDEEYAEYSAALDSMLAARTEGARDAVCALFADVKTDEEKSNFFLSGRAYETGIIAASIQNDVAMAYHRCAEFAKELGARDASAQRDEREAESWLMELCSAWDFGIPGAAFGDIVRRIAGAAQVQADVAVGTAVVQQPYPFPYAITRTDPHRGAVTYIFDTEELATQFVKATQRGLLQPAYAHPDPLLAEYRDLALEMTGAAQANLAQSDLWRLRYETLRALYPSAPSEYELDTAINHAAKVQAAKEGKS